MTDELDVLESQEVPKIQPPESGAPFNLVEDVISRVDRNEYKRHQAAPGLKVTTKAFGYGRRYPLAQRYNNRIIHKN